MSIKDKILRFIQKKKILKRIRNYQIKEISRIAVIYYIPKTNTEKYNNWSDGFTSAVKLLDDEFKVTWINLADQKPTATDLNAFDFLIVKSCWNWIVDRYIRSLECLNTPRGIMISCSKKSIQREWMFFYDILWYETNWYKEYIAAHPYVYHAFGINSEVFHNRNLDKIYDVVSIGALTAYKRHNEILKIPGQNKLVIGNKNEKDSQQIIDELEKESVNVLDYVSQEKLSIILNQTKLVYIPAEVDGGGERAVLEARKCGAEVLVQKDNPKLEELLKGEVWDQFYYSNQLKKGIFDIQNKLS
jgi:hypothetical protein